MDDIIQIIVTQYLLQSTDITSLLAFVRLQATHRPTWLRYKNDRALWLRLGACLPKWSLPEHLGIRRRVITGIKLMLGKCIACYGHAPRVFMAFQARFCRKCCHRLLISDFELAWRHGVQPPPEGIAFIVRYAGQVRVRLYLKQHLKGVMTPPEHVRLTRNQMNRFLVDWPGLRLEHIKAVINRMA
jgi:hypothetical protein